MAAAPVPARGEVAPRHPMATRGKPNRRLADKPSLREDLPHVILIGSHGGRER
jgi:hypothetical protein